MTVLQKYTSYLRYEKNYSLHTEISYLNDLNQFEGFLKLHSENLSLTEVDNDVVRTWIASLMETGLTARSVNRKLSALKSFYHYLVRIGLLQTNPMKKVVGPKIKKPLPSFVNDTDMEHILDSEPSTDDFENCRNLTILELLYVTGMRRAELIGLKDGDVDFFSNQVRVTGKRNKQRLIPFSADTRTVLEKYLAKRNDSIENLSGSFFVKNDGEAMYPVLLYRIIHNALKHISTLGKASPHVLRHTFATAMLNNGSEINAVKELLGHSSLASTEVYTHTSFEELKQIYNAAHPRA
jgi:integrase/recombinase XerC